MAYDYLAIYTTTYSHDVSVGGAYIALYTYLYKKPMGKNAIITNWPWNLV